MKNYEIKEFVSKRAGDTYYRINHPTGLRIFIYPKENCCTSYAVFGAKYGSVDNCFRRSDEQEAQTVPEGIAHYLEHKLFESDAEDAFERYARTGASANAFTSFESTCYLFSCTERFYDSLEILLDFVQNGYFTEETVAKEQGIIGQEIKMYEDDPQWRVMFNYLRGMYHNHPIRLDIAGTVESIAQITPELLYRCYDTFYNLNNMALSVAGNVDVEKVLEVCDMLLKPTKPLSVERVFQEEPASVVQKRVEQHLSVASPLFQFGFKEPVFSSIRSEREIAAMGVALEILSSDSSPLFADLLEKGLINEASFGAEYFEGAGYGTIMFGGESENPEEVARLILEAAEKLKEQGINQADFDRAKKAIYGQNIAALNSTSNLANALTSFAFRDRELFAYLDALAELTPKDVEGAFKKAFCKENTVLSVILPL